MALVACVAALWLVTRPYYGIAHDSRLYTVQALNALYPGKFSEDLYLKFGSQDQFTLFTYLYAPVINCFGLSYANLILTVVAQVIWLAGLVFLIRGFTRRVRDVLMSIALVVAIPASYGAAHLLGYGEPFLTPRLPAEAMILTALGLLVRGRPVGALSLAGVAACLHPIMALPGLAVILLYMAGRRWRWLAAGGAGAAAVIALAAAGVSPFSRIGATFDPQWFDYVRERSPFIFLLRWSLYDWSLVVATASLLGLALVFSDRRERSLLLAIAVVGIGGLACALVGGDLLRNVLVVEAQPLRALWLVTVIAHVFVLRTFLRMAADESDTGRLLRGGLVMGVLLLMLMQPLAPAVLLAAPVLLVTWLGCLWLHLGRCVPPSVMRCGAIAGLSIVLGGLLSFAYLFVRVFLPWPQELFLLAGTCIFTLVTLGVVVASGLSVSPIPTKNGWTEMMLAVGLFAVSIFAWDQRQPWSRYQQSDEPVPSSLATLLPEHASVYWENGTPLMWFRLKRPQYFSCMQGGGTVFFRDTAIEYQRLAETFSRLHTMDFDNGIACPALGSDATAVDVTAADLRYVCQRESRLDYMVLLRQIPDASARIWSAPAVDELVTFGRTGLTIRDQDTYFIYACADFRQG
jgi:hypothetical protein